MTDRGYLVRSVGAWIMPLLALTVVILWANDDKKAVEGAKDMPVSLGDQVKILKAQHEFDEIEQRRAQLNIQYMQLTQQLVDLRNQYSALDGPEKSAQQTLDEAIAEVARASKIDLKEYTFDRKRLAFVPNPSKPAPAPPTPAPTAAAPK